MFVHYLSTVDVNKQAASACKPDEKYDKINESNQMCFFGLQIF